VLNDKISNDRLLALLNDLNLETNTGPAAAVDTEQDWERYSRLESSNSWPSSISSWLSRFVFLDRASTACILTRLERSCSC